MRFNKRLLQLRRVDLMMHHDAAFLFWNVKGLLAERWAHGPDFKAYSHGPDEVQIKPELSEPQDRVISAGLRRCGIWSERRDQSMAEVTELTKEWISDCIDVMSPQNVTRFTLQAFWSYPVAERDRRKVSAGIDDVCGPSPFEISGFSSNDSGVTAALRRTRDGVDEFNTLIFGMYGREQAGQYFQWMPDDEQVPALGMQAQVGWSRGPAGYEDPRAMMDRFLSEAFDWSKSQLMNTVAAVVNSSG